MKVNSSNILPVLLLVSTFLLLALASCWNPVTGNPGDSHTSDVGDTTVTPPPANSESMLLPDVRTKDARFGCAVSISGDYALVGAEWEDNFNGAAYFLVTDGAGNWSEDLRVQGGNPENLDYFGGAVAISGDYAIIGARGEDEDINGDPSLEAGAAYMYHRDAGGNWNQTDTIIPSSSVSQTTLLFGTSVAIDGEYAVIGAPYEDKGTTAAAGAVYVFHHEGSGIWTEKAVLYAGDAQASDHFGLKVAISGDFILVGTMDETGGPGYNKSRTGAVYIFRNDGNGNWTQNDELHSDSRNMYDWFGASVAIDGDTAIIGAPGENGGVGYSVTDGGVVYVYRNDGTGVWTKTDKLYASEARDSDNLGRSLSISGAYLVAGSGKVDSYPDGSIVSVGAAYIYQNDGAGSWDEKTEFLIDNPGMEDFLGESVATDGVNAVFGAYGEDGGDGDPLNSAGAVYALNNLSY